MKWKKGCDMTMVDQNENSIFLSFSSNNLIKEPEFASNETRDSKHSNAVSTNHSILHVVITVFRVINLLPHHEFDPPTLLRPGTGSYHLLVTHSIHSRGCQWTSVFWPNERGYCDFNREGKQVNGG